MRFYYHVLKMSGIICYVVTISLIHATWSLFQYVLWKFGIIRWCLPEHVQEVKETIFLPSIRYDEQMYTIPLNTMRAIEVLRGWKEHLFNEPRIPVVPTPQEIIQLIWCSGAANWIKDMGDDMYYINFECGCQDETMKTTEKNPTRFQAVTKSIFTRNNIISIEIHGATYEPTSPHWRNIEEITNQSSTFIYNG